MCVYDSYYAMGMPVPKSEKMFITKKTTTHGSEYSGVSREVHRPRRDTEHQILIAKYGEAKANAVWKMKQEYHRIDQQRAERGVKVIDYIQPNQAVDSSKRPTRSKSIHVCRCKATTMSGRQCPFKASHGDFCKKHKV